MQWVELRLLGPASQAMSLYFRELTASTSILTPQVTSFRLLNGSTPTNSTDQTTADFGIRWFIGTPSLTRRLVSPHDEVKISRVSGFASIACSNLDAPLGGPDPLARVETKSTSDSH